MKKATNNHSVLIEIIKYGSKIFTDPDLKKKNETKNVPPKVYIKALYNILDAFSGHRLFASFGFKLTPKQKEAPKPFITTNYTEWHFNPFIHDWFNPETGEVLSHYEMPDELADLLKNNINKELD